MTIQELIDHLQQYEDKSLKVHVYDEDGYMGPCHDTTEYPGGVVELF